MIRRIQWGCIRILFWAILTFAISISGLRFALSELGLYKTDIEAQLSAQLGAPVTIEHIQGVLNGIKPELALHNIQVHSKLNGETTVQLKEIHLGLSLVTAMSQPLLQAIRISIIGAQLSVTRLPTGGISIEGLPKSDDNSQPTWLLKGKQFQLIDSEILWLDKKRNAKPMQLKHVNISIYNNDQQHTLQFKTELPETLGQSLRIAMNITGNPFTPANVDARLFVQGTNIKLDKLITGDLPFNFSFTQGIGNFKVWSKWHKAQMFQMTGSAEVNNAIILDQEEDQYHIDLSDLNFKLQKHQQQWHLALKDSLLQAKDNTLAIDQFALAFDYDEAQEKLIHLAVNTPQLALEPLSKIIQHYKFLPDTWHKLLQGIALEGELQDLQLLANPSQQTFTISGQIQRFKTSPVDTLPGVDELAIFFQGSDKTGVIHINSEQLIFDAPTLFQAPITLTHALGELHWQHEEAWTISSTLLELHSAQFDTNNAFALTLAQDGQPAFMHLQSTFNIPDVAHVPHFLPKGVMNKDTKDWLDHAFVSGNVAQGGLIFRGAPDRFPFLQHDGVFEVLFTAKDLELHYAPEWKNIQNLTGEVRFFADSMNIDIHHGRANKATIQQANVAIDSFVSSEYINIKGDVKSPFSSTVEYLSHSPFKDKVSAINKIIDLQGSTDINIELEIPLVQKELKANIRAVTKNANAKVIPVNLPVTDINADFLFTQKGIFSKQLTAHTLGSSVSAAVSSNAQGITTTLFGNLSISKLAEQFPNRLWAHLSGTSKYHIDMDFPQDSDQLSTLQLYSDLVGTSVDFTPLSKPAKQAHPLHLKLGIDSAGLDMININYENPLSPKNRIDIKLKKIAPNWQGLIHSPIASGSVFMPMDFTNKGKISLSLKEINLSALKQIDLKNDSSPLLIKNTPSISLNSQALYWNNLNLGSLLLNTEPSDTGLTIKECKITSANDSLSFSGTWGQNNEQQSSSIKGQLLSQNFGELLKQTKLSNNIIGTTAELHFNLNWPAAPYEISQHRISGTMDSYLTNGRIIGVDPGLGRILGALDIWKLGKRLRFDFSDITEKGLSFTSSTGYFTLDKGLVRTKDLNIDAMPAEIDIVGFTNLANEQINLRATVLPKFPIAGTIIGNVANAVSKTLVGNAHAGGLIASLLYEIQGTWEEYDIKRQYNSILPPPANIAN